MNYENIYLSSSSSSSSSSDDDLFIPVVLAEALHERPKNKDYVESIVPQYNMFEFIEHFRVKREIVDMLSEGFEASPYYPERGTGHERISGAKCILVFCWYAGHEAASFRDVADRFSIAISTLHGIVNGVSAFLSNMSSQVIKWPTAEETVHIVQEFEHLGFPNVIGCLDGTHIRIDKPSEDPDSYINRNKYYSIQMQAVCDNKRKIRDVFIGYPGSVHDSRVFRTSPLSHSIEENCGEYVILADSAYPCLQNILTPYRDNGHLTPIERNFNIQLSRSRISIEHTFGILKQKFRQLYHLKLRNIEAICHFIRACCVLHNLALDDDILVNENGVLAGENEVVVPANDDENEGNEAGHNKRNYVAAMLYNR